MTLEQLLKTVGQRRVKLVREGQGGWCILEKRNRDFGFNAGTVKDGRFKSDGDWVPCREDLIADDWEVY